MFSAMGLAEIIKLSFEIEIGLSRWKEHENKNSNLISILLFDWGLET